MRFTQANVVKAAPRIDGQVFPRGFLWGTGEDAYQHEGGNLNNDWSRWESLEPSPIKNGDRCLRAADFWERWESDFRLCEADGHNVHRIGIEWSRVEPARGAWDESAFERYGAMLRSLKAKGFTVFLNLWHFTLPLWAADAGGWEDPALMERWELFVSECARRFGPWVDYWSTMIDAQIYALQGYALGIFPPQKRDMALALRIYRALVVAHAAAYRIIKEKASRPAGSEGRPPVGMIYFFFHYESGPSPLDAFARRQLDAIFNEAFLDALVSGRIDLRVAFGPSVRERIDGVEGSLDWIGVNYYTRELIRFDLRTPGFVKRSTSPAGGLTDMGWEIFPEGIYRLCRKLERRYPGIPLFIAECGCADAADSFRPRFILDHLAWVHRLVEESCPVRGFSYWSLTDNWEWAEGFYPKFGLYSVDRRTFERTETGSARLFRLIARNNRLPTAPELADLGL